MVCNTISKEVTFKGIGLHTGVNTSITLKPNFTHDGIRFIYNDKCVKALCKNVTFTYFCTMLQENEISIYTVEHLLAALYALNISCVDIYMTEREIPIMDGSSAEFYDTLKDKVMSTLTKKHSIKILKPIHVEHGTSKAILLPSIDDLILDVTIDFIQPIGEQRFVVHKKDFGKEIASARTFGFMEEISKIKEKGLAKGGSLENAVVIDKGVILNKLRFKDEFVRHKILDVIGDLSLTGFQISGMYVGYKPGHTINSMLCKELFSRTDHWEFV